MLRGTTIRALLASTVLVSVPLLADAQMREGQRAGDAPGMGSVQNQQGQPAATHPQMGPPGAQTPGAQIPGAQTPGVRVGATGHPTSSGSPSGVGTGPAMMGQGGTNPPGTAAERALDRAAGTNTSGAFPNQSDGTPANPPGTAVGRAVDRATDGAATQSTGGATPMARPNVTGAVGGATATPAGMAGNFAERPRVSQIIGSRVYNESNESIGEVDEVLLMQGGSGPMAVLQIGGFLGIGGRMVAIPLSDLRWNQERERWVLRGATREQMQQRPEFQYSQLRRS